MKKFINIRWNNQNWGDNMGTHVQTEVNSETHDILKMLAILRRKSLKEIAREALEEYAKKHKKELEDLIQKDPIWGTIGVLELEEDASEREDWGTVEWQSE